jgi:replicative DNA helicase
MEVLIAKHRNRGPNSVRVAFNGSIHRFDDAAFSGAEEL